MRMVTSRVRRFLAKGTVDGRGPRAEAPAQAAPSGCQDLLGLLNLKRYFKQLAVSQTLSRLERQYSPCGIAFVDSFYTPSSITNHWYPCADYPELLRIPEADRSHRLGCTAHEQGRI